MTGQWREIRLPADLCEAAEKQYAGEYASLDELLTHMLRYVTTDTNALDQSELKIIEERLKDLGYM